MTRTRSALSLTLFVLVCGGLVVAQKPSDTLPPGKSPHLGNKASIRSGLTLYRVRCGDCHGLDARGYRGPDLTAVLGGMPDERLFQTIRKGVPGTEMPPSTAPDDDVLMIIAYLRDMNAGGSTEPVAGNVENGAKLFAGQCASCHRVGTTRWTPGSRLVASRRRAIAGGPRQGNPHAVGMDSAGLRDGDAGDERRPEDSRRQEERGCVLDPDHGHARAHPGSPPVRAARGDLRTHIVDAGVRSRAAE